MSKYIDSCVYADSYKKENLIKLEKKLRKANCKKALLQIPKFDLNCNEKLKFILKKNNFFIPVPHLQKKKN